MGEYTVRVAPSKQRGNIIALGRVPGYRDAMSVTFNNERVAALIREAALATGRSQREVLTSAMERYIEDVCRVRPLDVQDSDGVLADIDQLIGEPTA